MSNHGDACGHTEPGERRNGEPDGFTLLSDWLAEHRRIHAAGARKAITAAFDSPAMRRLLEQLQDDALDQHIDPCVLKTVWLSLRREAIARVANGTAFDWSLGPTTDATFALTNLHIGELAVLHEPPMMLVMQNGAPLILAQTAVGATIAPTSTAGKAITVLDIVLEMAGAVLLLVNVVLPRFNWGRVMEVVGERANVTALEGIAGLIAALGKMISEGEPMEKILKQAIKILMTALGLEGGGGIYDLLKKGLELDLWDWLELIAKFVLLSALEAGADSVSAGAATAAKVTLVGATIADIVLKKVPRLS